MRAGTGWPKLTIAHRHRISRPSLLAAAIVAFVGFGVALLVPSLFIFVFVCINHVGCCGMSRFDPPVSFPELCGGLHTDYTLPIQGREAVFPTRQSLGLMKGKLKGAETGHSLLKRKSEALTKYVL